MGPRWWYSERLALAIDPTLKGDQTTAIVISVVYRSCAIPVAPYPVRGRLWSIHRATQKGSPYPVRGRLWMDPTMELLRELAPAVPRDMTVIVLCDRGISSPKLWKQIRAQGWHPGMRYRKNVTFCADGGKRLPALAFVPVPDTAWIGRGAAGIPACGKPPQTRMSALPGCPTVGLAVGQERAGRRVSRGGRQPRGVRC